MSRTYRRKGKVPIYAVSDWIWFEEGLIQCERVHYKNAKLKKAIAKYHSDSQQWIHMGSIPAWFRRDFGHKYDRQRTRQALHRELYSIEYGNELFDKPRNLDWLWW
mgnify:CR=1 FL=1